jgi:hypothetical protein
LKKNYNDMNRELTELMSLLISNNDVFNPQTAFFKLNDLMKSEQNASQE